MASLDNDDCMFNQRSATYSSVLNILQPDLVVDSGAGSSDNDNDETMEDADEAEQDAPADAEADVDNDDENPDNDDEDDPDDNQDYPEESPSRPRPRPQPAPNGSQAPSRFAPTHSSPRTLPIRSSASPRTNNVSSYNAAPHTPQSPSQRTSFNFPAVRPDALTALTYDIAPTIAAPHSTSINAVTATPDMRWVFSGGADGWIRKFNWVDTVNAKTMLTVAQKHPFVDSVTKAGVLISYWENEEPSGQHTSFSISLLRRPNTKQIV